MRPFLLLALLAATSAAAAQSPDTTRASDAFCWRGRPLPSCGAFALFELGYFHALATTRLREPSVPPGFPPRDEPAFGRQVSWSVGAMRNLDRTTALGGAAVVGVGDGPFLAATGRWRRWLAPAASVELAAAPAAAQVPLPLVGTGHYGGQFNGWRAAGVAEARLNLGDLAAVSTRAVVVPRAGGRTQGALFVGASGGSGVAASGTVILGTLFLIAFAAFLGSAT
ncbi:hypothetical protein [Roseisolibacter sp. H3M3-2]|uniref:hypothetical protein n=1 Tax=Roseisolibacter sp. H3M3-2 TaxID=3031323 RepID=UPI0023DA98EA|nr:hypothetical protein [Roseisolibacter sp. H3M3-2]MDF1505751.1 hypothetical protein [Roseisolibacter sp. H3M3-2]